MLETQEASLPKDIQLLLDALPYKYRRVYLEHPDATEITIQLNRPTTISWGSWDKKFVAYDDIALNEDDLDRILSRFAGIKQDKRAGIDGTAHRISVIEDKAYNIIGLTIRIARRVPTALPDDLKEELLKNKGSVLIVGAPGTGKTTLLRAIVATFNDAIGPHLNVIDTSNEIGGVGKTPVPELKYARWHQVPDPKEQPFIIRRAIANHNPLILVLDEIGYHGDVEEVEAAARRGIRVIATCHGFNIYDVLENPHYVSLFGNLDIRNKKRHGRPAFQGLIETRGRGKIYFHPNLADSIDRILANEPPQGVRLGNWEEDEPDYPSMAL